MNDELPPDVLRVLKQLWLDIRPLQISISKRDAWTAVAVIQYATRNPHLSDSQRAAATTVGLTLQHALEEVAPAAADLLEDGWNPAKDVPR